MVLALSRKGRSIAGHFKFVTQYLLRRTKWRSSHHYKFVSRSMTKLLKKIAESDLIYSYVRGLDHLAPFCSFNAVALDRSVGGTA